VGLPGTCGAGRGAGGRAGDKSFFSILDPSRSFLRTLFLSFFLFFFRLLATAQVEALRVARVTGPVLFAQRPLSERRGYVLSRTCLRALSLSLARSFARSLTQSASLSHVRACVSSRNVVRAGLMCDPIGQSDGERVRES
jgi:hypothetical protein